MAAVRERAASASSSVHSRGGEDSPHGSSSSNNKNSTNSLHLLLNPRRDLDRDLLEATVGVHSLEVKALDAVDEALAAAPSVEAATTVLASVVKAASSVDRKTATSKDASESFSSSTSSSPPPSSRSRLKAALLERLQPLLLRYADAVEGPLRGEYDSGKADPKAPPGAPRGAGGVLWARGLLERVEGPMKR